MWKNSISTRQWEMPCIFTLLMAVALPAEAQWTADSSVNTPVCTAFGDQLNPVTVTDGHGGVIVAWEDNRGASNIFAQRLDACGYPRWADDGIPLWMQPEAQQKPKVVSDSSGGAIVSWVDYRGGDTTIFVQRIDPSGVALWESDGVPVVRVRSGVNYQMAEDGSGGVILCWEDWRNGNADIYAQRLNGLGQPIWYSGGVPMCTDTSDQMGASLVGDGRGGAIVAWADMQDRTRLSAAKVGSGGSLAWLPNWNINCFYDVAQGPYAITDGRGGAILIWHEHWQAGMSVHGQRIDAEGVGQWGPEGVTIDTLGQGFMAIAYVVSDANAGVFTSLSAISGILEIPVLAHSDSAGLTSQFSYGIGTGGWVVPDGVGGATFMIYGPIDIPAPVVSVQLDASGQWVSRRRVVSTSASTGRGFTACSDGLRGAIAIWSDFRNGAQGDIYAQHIPGWGTSNVTRSQGWNLVSVPRAVSDSGAYGLFPKAMWGTIYGFLSGTYQRQSVLSPGQGYWALYDGSACDTLGGDGLPGTSLTINTGNRWVLVGSVSSALPTAHLASTPSGAIVSGSVYGFDGLRYEVPEELEPGKGYWVFVNAPCTLTIAQ